MSSEVAVEMKGGRWKRYPAYRDSGVEWLGEVPDGWEVKKVKRICLVKRGASPRPIDDPIYFDDDGEYSWVRISDVTASTKYLQTTEQKLSVLGKSKSVPLEPGELFLSIAGSVGKPILAAIKCCIHDGFVYFVGLEQNRDYMYYIFLSGELYKGLGKFGTQLNLNTDTVGDIKIPAPSLPEQRAIATFLDRETGRIDTLIEKKGRQIELLQEKRAALISHAVTKGLDPGVKMKDSGVEWLGEVPEHWMAKRLKYITTANDETLSETTNPDFELVYVDIGSIDPISGIRNKETMTFENAPSRARRKVRNGDVIISTVRTYLRAISPVNYPEPNMVVSTGFAVIRPKENIESQFAAYALRAPYFVDKVVANSVGVSYPAINASELINFNIALPPLPEQHAIATFLDRETGRIDTLTTKLRESISKLHEYRTALISAAVTGKIDVRNKET